MERKESLLQHLGPPISPIALSDLAVILCDSAKGSCASGVELEMIEINIPELIPAPQAPQKPQAPPGTLFPRFIISIVPTPLILRGQRITLSCPSRLASRLVLIRWRTARIG